jgi:hypothetical protein
MDDILLPFTTTDQVRMISTWILDRFVSFSEGYFEDKSEETFPFSVFFFFFSCFFFSSFSISSLLERERVAPGIFFRTMACMEKVHRSLRRPLAHVSRL